MSNKQLEQTKTKLCDFSITKGFKGINRNLRTSTYEYDKLTISYPYDSYIDMYIYGNDVLMSVLIDAKDDIYLPQSIDILFDSFGDNGLDVCRELGKDDSEQFSNFIKSVYDYNIVSIEDLYNS